MLEALMEKLRKQLPTSGAAAAAAGGAAAVPTGEATSAVLAQRILDLAENHDWAAILSLLGPDPITSATPLPAMRKAYLKLSMIVHPDKLRSFPQATKAFQALVSAFERLSKPEEFADEEDEPGPQAAAMKARALSRSNNGCFQTTIKCPRCHEVWGGAQASLQGIENYYYNYLMMGLKTYCCSTCLCEVRENLFCYFQFVVNLDFWYCL
jgi:hypothetical protein